MSAYGRNDDEWDELVEAGKQFLRERALMERNTSYTEMSVTLARRTGYPAFDFSQPAERAAMGFLLGQIVQKTYPVVGAMMSALVIYLDANDAGPGFYQLAQDMGLLQKGASKQARDAFWVQQVRGTFDHFRPGGRI
ncbi:hypothetical protein ABZV78_28215 [Micromonospora sp. NPDC004540]|uniref:hypothetical protein n=1 Tax=Micromonospora sp. NPDC004540 TaxID=3154457 RepID=UPI0033B68355